MQTIIAAFDDRATAQQAIERLLESGFSHDDVHLQHGYDADSSAATEATDTHRSFFGAIEDMFTHIFSAESAGHAANYAEAVRRGNSVVVVDAHDASETEKARIVLGQFGTVDIDERALEWHAGGTAGDDAPSAQSPTDVPTTSRNATVGSGARTDTLRVIDRAGGTSSSPFAALREAPAQRSTLADPDFRRLRDGALDRAEPNDRPQTVSDGLVRPTLAGERVPRRTVDTGVGDDGRAATADPGADKSTPIDR